MTGLIVSGGPAWPRWLPWIGLRTRALAARDCSELAGATGAAFEPGAYREIALVWFGHDVSACVVPRGRRREDRQ